MLGKLLCTDLVTDAPESSRPPQGWLEMQCLASQPCRNWNCGNTLSIQRQDSLYLDESCCKAVLLKHGLQKPVPVALGIQGRICQKDFALCWVNLELFKECVVPYVLHVIPVLHYAI